MFRNNTAAFVHTLPDGAIANVEGESDYVRVPGAHETWVLLTVPSSWAVVEQFHRQSSPTQPAVLKLKQRTWVAAHRSPRRRLGTLGTRPIRTPSSFAGGPRAEAAKLAGGDEG